MEISQSEYQAKNTGAAAACFDFSSQVVALRLQKAIRKLTGEAALLPCQNSAWHALIMV